MAVGTIPCASSNFRQGRPTPFVPEAVVLHRTGGSRAAIAARYGSASSVVSAHYVVGRDGSVDRCVREIDTAFHAGLVSGAAWALLKPNVNPNFYTIGIELEGDVDADWPDAQITAAAGVIASVCRRWRIPVDDGHVIPHRAIRASSGCPAATLPLAPLLARAQAGPADSFDLVADGSADSDDGTTDAMDLDDGSSLRIDRTTLALPPSEYEAQAVPKDLIILHFTAGKTARSAFNTWRQDPRVIGTAYIVDVDGTIYEVFPPACWASHLGVKGTNGVHDRRSIGIEIANVGPLKPDAADPTVLNWWLPRAAGAPEFTTKFCLLTETSQYVTAAFRGVGHFAAFPVAQIDAVAGLVRTLCQQFSIPASLPAPDRRFVCDVNAFSTYSGVCTHANFRQDKWDIGPAFAWERLRLT